MLFLYLPFYVFDGMLDVRGQPAHVATFKERSDYHHA
jgi:hypothetical protein